MTKILQGIEQMQKGLCLTVEGLTEILNQKEAVIGVWLTRTEAADLLGVSPATITKIAKEMSGAGDPGVIRNTNFLRIEQDHLIRFANERSNK